MEILAIIPARYQSTRFPGKPLALIAGKPMIQRVYERTLACKRLNRVIVATDDQRIINCVESFGGEAMMTNSFHVSGTDRCAEISKKLPEYDIVINIQGDEPTINPLSLDSLATLIISDKKIDIATLRYPIKLTSHVNNPDVVKLVCDRKGKCLYFSRAAIPFQKSQERNIYQKHIGVYGFQREVLWELTNLKPSALELTEKLEQLRWIENGYSIYSIESVSDSIGIDSPEDLAWLNNNWPIS